MRNWQQGTLGDLIKGTRGVTYSAEQLQQHEAENTVTLLRSNNISDGQLNFRETQLVPDLLVSEEQFLQKKDIAVCMSNGSKALVGKSAPFLIDSDMRFTVGAFCSVFRPKNAADGAFIAQLFQSNAYRKHLDLVLAGTAINNLRNADIESFPCLVPPQSERNKIAQILDTLDTAIRETEAIIAKLQAVKQGLLHDLLTRGLDACGQLRPPPALAPELYQDSPLGLIPREWEAKELDQLVDTKRPIVYGILMPGYGHPDGVPVVKVKDIIGGQVQLDNLLLTNPKIDNEYKRSRLLAGDLLFTIRGTVGRTAFVPQALEGANITQDTARIGITGLDPRFVRAYLGMPIPAKFIAVHTLGVAVQGINLRDVRRIPIAMPPAEEASMIADKLDMHGAQLENELAALSKMRLQKSGLMDDLLTGRVRVKALEAATA